MLLLLLMFTGIVFSFVYATRRFRVQRSRWSDGVADGQDGLSDGAKGSTSGR